MVRNRNLESLVNHAITAPGKSRHDSNRSQSDAHERGRLYVVVWWAARLLREERERI